MLTAFLERLHPLVVELPLLLAAKGGSAATTPAGKSDAIPWAIVLFCVILGVIVSLNPSRRTYEIKHSKEE